MCCLFISRECRLKDTVSVVFGAKVVERDKKCCSSISTWNQQLAADSMLGQTSTMERHKNCLPEPWMKMGSAAADAAAARKCISSWKAATWWLISWWGRALIFYISFPFWQTDTPNIPTYDCFIIEAQATSYTHREHLYWCLSNTPKA